MLPGVSERLEYVDAPSHVADLKRYRARGYTMAGNRIAIVTDHDADLVEVHPPSRGKVDLGGVTVERPLRCRTGSNRQENPLRELLHRPGNSGKAGKDPITPRKKTGHGGARGLFRVSTIGGSVSVLLKKTVSGERRPCIFNSEDPEPLQCPKLSLRVITKKKCDDLPNGE